jgi:hypothetical protein
MRAVEPRCTANDDLETMDKVVEMVADGRLVLVRLPLAEIALSQLNADHLERLARWREAGVMGKRSLELLPSGMWWMQLHGQLCQTPQQAEMYSKSWTHRVHFGRPSLGWMVGVFESQPSVRRQCLIPHLSRTEPNELLAFERGPSWNDPEPQSGKG